MQREPCFATASERMWISARTVIRLQSEMADHFGRVAKVFGTKIELARESGVDAWSGAPRARLRAHVMSIDSVPVNLGMY